MRSRLTQRDRSERGATMVEFALVFGFLVMLAFGAFEYGMAFPRLAFGDDLASEGGHPGGGNGSPPVLDLRSGGCGADLSVRRHREQPRVDLFADPALFAVHSGRPSWVVCNGSSWNAEHLGSGWDPPNRVSAAGVHWTGVRVVFEHEWFTNFLW